MIEIDKANSEEAAVYPSGRMGKDKFQRFLDMCHRHDSHFDKLTKKHMVPIENAYALMRELEDTGFSVNISAKVTSEVNLLRGALNNRLRAIEEQDLYPFQKIGSKWLTVKDKALLADDMGLGKTRQALCAIPPEVGVIVVCPASVKNVWLEECHIMRPEILPTILEGRSSFRWPITNEMIILNYELLPKFPGEPPAGIVVIADEAHYLKGGGKRKRGKCFLTLRKSILNARGKIWLLTGTPMPNEPMELWNILNMADLTRATFGTWDKFCDVFNGHKGRFGLEWGSPDKGKIAPLLKGSMMRRKRKQVLPELPDKTYRIIRVEVDLALLMFTDDYEVEQAIERAIDYTDDLPEFFDLSEIREKLSKAKTPAIIPLIETYEEANEPVVVFSDHIFIVNELKERSGWVTVQGSDPPQKRNESVSAFQEGRCKGIALTIGAGGEGITLTRSHHVVFVDMAWTPAKNAQAEDRVCRIGQDRGVIVTRVVANHSIDERITAVLAKKQKLINSTL